MSATEQNQNLGALAREWLWARIVVGGGFAIAIAVAAYFTFGTHLFTHELTPEEIAQARAKADAAAALQLCTTVLNEAKNFGIVPNYGKLANATVQATDVQGRFVCTAATNVTKYLLAADLICREYGNQRCVSIFSITEDDGTVLYQRQS